MSGWKTATIKTENTQELNMEINHRDKEKKGFTKLSDNAFRLFGYEAEIEDEIAEILHETEIENGQVLLIEANDTTDSGQGILYDIKELRDTGEVEMTQIDTKRGYEGAIARDVTGYFREEHGVNGHTGYY